MVSIQQCYHFIEHFSEAVEHFVEGKGTGPSQDEVWTDQKSLKETDSISSAISLAEVCLETIQSAQEISLSDKVDAVARLLQSVKAYRIDQESKEYCNSWINYLMSFIRQPSGIKILCTEEKIIQEDLKKLQNRLEKIQAESLRKEEMQHADVLYKKQLMEKNLRERDIGLHELEEEIEKASQQQRAQTSSWEDIGLLAKNTAVMNPKDVQELEELDRTTKESEVPAVDPKEMEELEELDRIAKESEVPAVDLKELEELEELDRTQKKSEVPVIDSKILKELEELDSF